MAVSDYDLETFGGRIQFAREYAHLTRAELAKKVKISDSGLANIEKNRSSTPNSSVILKIASECETDWRYFFGLIPFENAVHKEFGVCEEDHGESPAYLFAKCTFIIGMLLRYKGEVTHEVYRQFEEQFTSKNRKINYRFESVEPASGELSASYNTKNHKVGKLSKIAQQLPDHRIDDLIAMAETWLKAEQQNKENHA